MGQIKIRVKTGLTFVVVIVYTFYLHLKSMFTSFSGWNKLRESVENFEQQTGSLRGLPQKKTLPLGKICSCIMEHTGISKGYLAAVSYLWILHSLHHLDHDHGVTALIFAVSDS